jgi:hypothetical protein
MAHGTAARQPDQTLCTRLSQFAPMIKKVNDVPKKRQACG